MVFYEERKAIHEDDRPVGEFTDITLGDWRGEEQAEARTPDASPVSPNDCPESTLQRPSSSSIIPPDSEIQQRVFLPPPLHFFPPKPIQIFTRARPFPLIPLFHISMLHRVVMDVMNGSDVMGIS
jgi:hypothetical protein